MGLKYEGRARVWKVENKGKYSLVQLSTSKKDKQKSEAEGKAVYETDFQDSYVRFIGTAHELISKLTIPEKGIDIKIGNFEVTNKYDAEKQRTYVNYSVFSFDEWKWDDQGQQSATKHQKAATPPQENLDIDSDDLPF